MGILLFNIQLQTEIERQSAYRTPWVVNFLTGIYLKVVLAYRDSTS